MNAVLLIAHAPLANALRQGALHVFPDAAADIAALAVDPDAPPEQTLVGAEALRARWCVRAVLVLSDVLGATPCNVAQRLCEVDRVRLLAGVNLPMLLRAITYRAEPLAAMAQRALDGGVRGVVAVAPAAATEPALKGAA